MKTVAVTLLLSFALASVTAHAEDQQPTPKKDQPTQSQLALDHGPRAQVTPAVKRARQEAAKAASAASQTK